VRFPALLTSMCAVLLLSAPAAMAQQEAETAPAPQQQPAPATGGAEYGVDPAAVPRTFVPGDKAVLLENGYAAAPTNAPPAVQEAVFAANEIVGKPYRYGGGHRRFKDSGYDCSGTVSYALKGASLLASPLDSSSFMRWGDRGKGQWITVYTNPGHAFVIIAGLRLDTSAAGERRSSGKGPRWRSNLRGGRGFRTRHPAGL
jgi:cell wall-associated NlpC family hydrolase